MERNAMLTWHETYVRGNYQASQDYLFYGISRIPVYSTDFAHELRELVRVDYILTVYDHGKHHVTKRYKTMTACKRYATRIANQRSKCLGVAS